VNDIERFQQSRAYLAQVYAVIAAKLAQAVKDDPTANLWAEYRSCQIAWGALVDIENTLRASVLAGDPIDDFYREGVDRTEGHEPA
jgi:hypothetical protein